MPTSPALAALPSRTRTAEGDVDRPGRIVVRDPSRTGDEVLDEALDILVHHQGMKPGRVLKPLGKNLRRTLYERLARTGVVRAEKGAILGVFPTHRRPAQDSSHEAEVRQAVRKTIDDTTAALAAAIVASSNGSGST